MKRFIPIACRGALVLGAGLLCRAPGANAIGFGVRTDLGYDSFTQSNTRDSALERAPFGGFGYALDAEIVPLRIDDLRVLTQVGFRGVLLEKEGSENGVTTTATFKSFLLGFDVGAGYEFMKGLQGDLLLGADYGLVNSAESRLSSAPAPVETKVESHSRGSLTARMSYELVDDLLVGSLSAKFRYGCYECRTNTELEIKRYTGYALQAGLSLRIAEE